MKKLIGQELGLCVEGSSWLAESLESAVGHRELLWFAPLEETGGGRETTWGQPLSGPRDQERVSIRAVAGQWRRGMTTSRRTANVPCGHQEVNPQYLFLEFQLVSQSTVGCFDTGWTKISSRVEKNFL